MYEVVNKNCQIAFQTTDLTFIPSISVWKCLLNNTQGNTLLKVWCLKQEGQAEALMFTHSAKNRSLRHFGIESWPLSNPCSQGRLRPSKASFSLVMWPAVLGPSQRLSHTIWEYQCECLIMCSLKTNQVIYGLFP